MNFEEEAKSWVRQNGIDFVEKIRLRKSDNSLVVYVTESYKKNDEIVEVSDNKINKLKRDLESLFEVDVTIIKIKDDYFLDLEESLKVIVNNRLERRVVNFFITFIDSKKAEVWLETDFPEQKEEVDVYEIIKSVFSSAEIEISGFNWVNVEEKVPSLLQILMLIKVYQPIKNDEIVAKLLDKGFYSVDEKWISAKLDQLRKKRTVIRQKGGTYTMCSKGLSVIPQAYGKNSSDVVRALALGRNRWSN